MEEPKLNEEVVFSDLNELSMAMDSAEWLEVHGVYQAPANHTDFLYGAAMNSLPEHITGPNLLRMLMSVTEEAVTEEAEQVPVELVEVELAEEVAE
jgi:hypothetical protein